MTSELSSERTSGGQPDPVMARLESTLGYYDRQASWSRVFFVVSKVATVLVAAAIPVLSGFGPQLLGSAELATLVVGMLGAVIVVIEGLLRLFQWEQHWLRYRGTWLALDREKALYVATAGPYGDAENPRRLLAERVEDLQSRENLSWVALYDEKKQRGSSS